MNFKADLAILKIKQNIFPDYQKKAYCSDALHWAVSNYGFLEVQFGKVRFDMPMIFINYL